MKNRKMHIFFLCTKKRRIIDADVNWLTVLFIDKQIQIMFEKNIKNVWSKEFILKRIRFVKKNNALSNWTPQKKSLFSLRTIFFDGGRGMCSQFTSSISPLTLHIKTS